MLKNFFYFFAVIITIGFTACGPDEPGEDPCENGFDQVSLFTHIVNHTLQPGYQDLELSINNLRSSYDQFALTANENTLQLLREKYTEAYIIWQKMAQFEFGPAKEKFLRNSINNFPLNEQEVLNNINLGVYDFSMPDRYDKGFPALDYLLYGMAETDQEIINKFSFDPNAMNYRNYTLEVIVDMVERVRQTRERWEGDDQNEFKNNTGTAAGTSLSLIINGFNENYELIKREKLGVPSGVLTLDIPNPDRVEAIHSELSTILLKAGFLGNIDLFNGLGYDGVQGPGLDDLLDAANATQDGTPLSSLISNQFEIALSELDKLNDPLDDEIANNKDQVIKTYAELTRPLVNIKTDMPSVLCVSITYIDNPSDSD